MSRVESGAMASVFASQTPCRLSYARTGSLARDAVPGGTEVAVSPGRMPSRHVLPPSFEVEKAMLAAPPVRFRPFWKSATVVAPTVWESGSTCVSCWLSAFDCRSRWMRVLTISQSLWTHVACIGGDDVPPGPAGDPVDAAVVLGRDPVVTRSRDDAIGAVPAGEEVRASRPEDLRGRSGGSDGGQRREEQSDRQARAHR